MDEARPVSAAGAATLLGIYGRRSQSWICHGGEYIGDTHVTPGGLEGYFDELSALIQKAPSWPLADMRPVVALMERYDTYAPPAPRTA